MSAGITHTSYTLTFCLNVQSVATATGTLVTGPIGTNGGYNGVAAVSFPTYPQAFLGNNGFYTVSTSQHPALYQQNSGVGKTTTVTITNIEVSDTNERHAATGWELVTGDAETTDAGESMTWSTSNPNTPLNLLPNTPSSPIGDACSNPVSPSGLTGSQHCDIRRLTDGGLCLVHLRHARASVGHGHARIAGTDAAHGDHGRDRP